ncbi:MULTISPECIES: actin-binding WH2 domain-containing protein [Trichocoleus]|uniref:Actin-binding WH2 domain-containing protein n=1 Tax=Trichocoleus desertorum GB2-A4 TaxID=2933944 RepID=A0ABV0J4Q7_9CYAN|nr:actin-binding WH2 domain-containing protein [Trichocoleus sp. FACHB-46]MBD1863599.1 actin-binding WH2 domain-containing protein [Trichocoleus sp. FACHB-46]
MNYFSVLITLLRDRKDFIDEVRQGIRLNSKITSLLISSSILFAIYGAVIGAFAGPLQALSSAVKLPALYLITLIICLPTLYFFNIIFGSKLTLGQHFVVLLGSAAIISILLFSFAPVTLFFLATIDNYQFFKLLNVVIFGITGFLGINFLYHSLQALSPQDSAGQATRTQILQSWLILYAFVGSQLGWTLRPFFGAPGEPFELFRDMQGNFYLNVIQSILEVLGLR